MKKVLLTLPITLICLLISMGSAFACVTADAGKAGATKAVEAQVKVSGPGDELKKLNEQITSLENSAFVNTKKADNQRKLLLEEISNTANKVENGEYNAALKNLKTGLEKSIGMWISRAEQPKLFKSIDTIKVSINNASKTTVKTAYGKVSGADAGNGSWVWAGIPYAKPPVGELRWKAPQDPEPWNKIRHSTYNFSRCTQPVFDLQWNPVNKIQGSEDCLYLNVFRPKNNAKNLPVYFWIHGGGNSFDGADNYDASILAQKANMVVVVIQFRTGPFGWFNHPALNPDGTAEDKSGNYGTLDMIKALKWVNRNISAFGGNPKNVTIAGESTGGYRVMNLMIHLLQKDFSTRP
jgi:para-nitrobenzyl esterase